MFIGVDFGTSNTSAAVFDGEHVHYIPLDPDNPDDKGVLNSVLLVSRQEEFSIEFRFGARAVNGYQRIMAEEEVETERQEIGDLSMYFADDQTVTVKGYGMVEVARPGRMFQYLKKFLGKNIRTNLFGINFKVYELIAQILKFVKNQVEENTGQSIDSVLMGRPVRFSEDDRIHERAVKELRIAAELSGFKHIEFQYEPIAASYHYSDKAIRPENVIIFDIGAGTSDITVVRAENGETKILGLAGIPLGGSDFDKEIMYEKISPSLGRGVSYKGVEIPNTIYRKITTWQSIPQLITDISYLSPIEYLLQLSPDKELFEALQVLVTEEHGFPMFQKIEQTKKELTDNLSAKFEYNLWVTKLTKELSRQEFNRMLIPHTDRIFQTLDDALSQAGLSSYAVDRVIRVGGSARIPYIYRQLCSRFGEEKILMQDELKNVVAGLAIEAFGMN